MFLLQKFRDLFADRRGNVAFIFGISALPLTFAVGMAIDYGTAARKRSQLNAAADAAVLAAVTPSMMSKTSTEAQIAATNAFNARISMIKGVTLQSGSPQITVTEGILSRSVQVSYQAQVNNAFSVLYQMPTTQIGGTATSSASVPPNIDFYLLLDDSPSMAIAATSAGIKTMEDNTAAQGKCAFGCHQKNPKADKLGNPDVPGQPGTMMDNYALARSLNVVLRIDNLQQAVSQLMTTVQNTMTSNNAKYRAGIYSFDMAMNTIQTLTSDLATAKTNAGNITLQQVYSNNKRCSDSACSSGVSNNDTDTNFTAAFDGVNKAMPAPGGGTNVSGDTPQEVLFLVTDGVRDENVSGARMQSVIDTSWCTTIKNRNIRIAVLYTTYLPLPNNSWYKQYISPFQSNIGPTLESCASPGLYYEVSTDQDISTGLNKLFQLAVATAHLTR